MPTVLRHGRWRLFFYSNEGSEPAHVHVESAGGTATFLLTPVALVGSNRLKPDELRAIERFVKQHRTRLLDASPEQRADGRLIGGGEGIRWESLDEDLSVRGLLRGEPARL